MGGILSFVSQIFRPAAELIDDLHTSEEEKLAKKAALLEVQARFLESALQYEQEQLTARAEIITAEAKSEHWLTATWRPITMLTFVSAVMAYWFGVTPDTLPPEHVDRMFTLVQIGVGGYIGGRSVEKVVPAAIKALKQKEHT